MNERIRELSAQAGWRDDKQFGSWNKLHQWQNFDKEKFAELIIKDCMMVCLMQRDPITLNYKTSERYVEQIAKFFGVEE
jgi:hypothetical protein